MGKGMVEEAIDLQKKASQISKNWSWGLALTYIATGQRDKALMIAKDLESQPKVWDTWCLAVIYANLKDSENFYRWFKAAYDQRHPWIPWTMNAGSGWLHCRIIS